MKNRVLTKITKIIFLCLTALVSTPSIFCMHEAAGEKLGDSWHFNTKIENKKERLIAEGFQEVVFHPAVETPAPLRRIFPNPDQNQGQQLRGLFLERPNARATIIFTPGFWPGLKEVFAPFVKLAPRDCNLFFIELAGHGESEGPTLGRKLKDCASTMLKNPIAVGKLLKQYGLHEHKDIIGAIYHALERTDGKPIILFGWCAGAFLAARTLIKLRELSPEGQDLIQDLNIQGLIFDSGFGSITDLIGQANDYVKNHVLKKKNKTDKKQNKPQEPQESQEKLLYRMFNKIKELFGKTKKTLKNITADLFIGFNKLLFGRSIRKNDRELNLYDKMQTIADLKVLFIHSRQDSLSLIAGAQRLAQNITNHEFWTTPHTRAGRNTHALNHLKFKEQYQEKLRDWLDKTIEDKKVVFKQAQLPRLEEVHAEIRQEIAVLLNGMIQIIDNHNNQDDQAEEQMEQLMGILQTLVQNKDELHLPENFIALYQRMMNKIEEDPDQEDLQEIRTLLIQMRDAINPEQADQNPVQNNNQNAQDNLQENQEEPQNVQIQNLQTEDLIIIVDILERVIIREFDSIQNTNPLFATLQEIITVRNWAAQLIIQNNLLPENPTNQELAYLRLIRNILNLTIIKTGNLPEEDPEYPRLQQIVRIKYYLDRFLNRKIQKKDQDAAGNIKKKRKKDPSSSSSSLRQGKNNPRHNGSYSRPIAGGLYVPKKPEKKSSGRSPSQNSSSSLSNSGSYSPSNSYGSSPSGYNYPSYSNQSPGGYGSGYGYGDSPSYDSGYGYGAELDNWAGNNNPGAQNKNQLETPSVTKYDIELMDDTYSEEDYPEMQDKPDKFNRKKL